MLARNEIISAASVLEACLTYDGSAERPSRPNVIEGQFKHLGGSTLAALVGEGRRPCRS
jgi:hypothetical protein